MTGQQNHRQIRPRRLPSGQRRHGQPQHRVVEAQVGGHLRQAFVQIRATEGQPPFQRHRVGVGGRDGLAVVGHRGGACVHLRQRIGHARATRHEFRDRFLPPLDFLLQ